MRGICFYWKEHTSFFLLFSPFFCIIRVLSFLNILYYLPLQFLASLKGLIVEVHVVHQQFTNAVVLVVNMFLEPFGQIFVSVLQVLYLLLKMTIGILALKYFRIGHVPPSPWPPRTRRTRSGTRWSRTSLGSVS